MISVAEFKREVKQWCEDVRVSPREIHFRKMKWKWASCSSKGRLTFSLDLLKEPVEVRAKAIVHELLHMRYPNHGKMFNTLLNTHLKNRGIKVRDV